MKNNVVKLHSRLQAVRLAAVAVFPPTSEAKLCFDSNGNVRLNAIQLKPAFAV